MKITILAALLALAAGPAVIAPAEAASPAVKGESAYTYRRDDYWRHNGRYHQRRHHEMRLRERRQVRDCQIITRSYRSNGRRVTEQVRDCD